MFDNPDFTLNLEFISEQKLFVQKLQIISLHEYTHTIEDIVLLKSLSLKVYAYF